MLIGDMSRLCARRFKDKVAFKDERKELTFEQVNQRSNAIIHTLMEMGVKKGDRIAILLYNCVQYSELLLALPKAGFIAVTLNYRLVARELEYLINNSEANTLIFEPELEDRIDALRPRLETIKNYIVLDSMGESKTEALNYEKLIEDHPTSEIPAEVNESDVAYILYTSGTTGRPKGAMLTHKNIITNLFNNLFELHLKPSDKIMNPLPLYHIAAQNLSIAFFFSGCTHVTIKQFDVELVLEKMYIEKTNIVHLIPATQNMIMNHPDIEKYDLRFLDLLIYGASHILRSQLKKSMEIFDCKFIQFAGQTESSPILTCLRPEDHVVDGPQDLIRRLSSAGKEAKLSEVKIVDQDGNEVPPNTPGELVGRGENIMKGYWKLPQATEETIVDGWLHTGDICMKDEDGYVYYVDRSTDMINRGGENVYPREIEEVITSHPSVSEVAVIGVQDERLQEEIMAVIVLNENSQVSEEEIVRLCEDNLARYKKARYVQFVDALPKNPTGKVLKHQLRKKYEKVSLPPKL